MQYCHTGESTVSWAHLRFKVFAVWNITTVEKLKINHAFHSTCLLVWIKWEVPATRILCRRFPVKMSSTTTKMYSLIILGSRTTLHIFSSRKDFRPTAEFGCRIVGQLMTTKVIFTFRVQDTCTAYLQYRLKWLLAATFIKDRFLIHLATTTNFFL